MRLNDALRIGASVVSLQRSKCYDAARIRAEQLERLGETLRFALERVPHYRQLRVDVRRGGPDDWLAQFPVLTKHDLQRAGTALLARGLSHDEVHRSCTSGSTGEPTVSYFDRRTWLFCKYALKLRRMLDCGLGPGAHVVVVSEGHAREMHLQRKAMMTGEGWIFHQDYLSLHTPIETHLQEIVRQRPDAIYAFPSYFADLLAHCEREGAALPPLRAIFTSSEVLPQALRRRLNERTGARICDVYGCTEFKEVAWQCASGCYHVNHESVWIETDADAVHGETGTLLLTTLVNRAGPLIRYRVGDLGRLEWTRCPCGREGPTLSRLEGREVELLELASGRRLSPYLLTTAVEDVAGLRCYQFVQTAADRLELRFMALDGQTPDHSLLHARLKALLGEHMRVQLAPASAIPRAPGGKRNVFVRDPALAGSR